MNIELEVELNDDDGVCAPTAINRPQVCHAKDTQCTTAGLLLSGFDGGIF